MNEPVLIGYWSSDQKPELPDPRKFMDPSWDPDERDVLADYLRGGLPVVHMMGYSPCRLCSRQTNGNSELTDGTYLWPEGLAHYVVDHQLRPPTPFVMHALRRFEALEAAAFEPSNRSLTGLLAMCE